MKKKVHKNSRLQKALDDGKIVSEDEFRESELNQIFENEWRQFVAREAWASVSKDINETMQKCFEMYINGISDTEISRALKIAESSVRVYKKRIRIRLSHEVARLENELN